MNSEHRARAGRRPLLLGLSLVVVTACHQQTAPQAPLAAQTSPSPLSAAQPVSPASSVLRPATPSTEATTGAPSTGPTHAPINAGSGPASQPAATAEGPVHWTNLKVLPPNISKAQLGDTMRSFKAALGVDCDFCHVKDGAFSADTPNKDTARDMLRMVGHIDQKYFGGKTVVVCATCHQGKNKPAATTPLPSAVFGTPP
jgi:hypothetical protein